MKIKKIILDTWIDPALITHHLTKKFGDKGLAWLDSDGKENGEWSIICLLYTSPSPRDGLLSRMPSSA